MLLLGVYSRVFRGVEKKQRANGMNGLRQAAKAFTLVHRLGRISHQLAATDEV